MSRPSDDRREPGAVFDRLIGLGETSVRKTYYPELQRRMEELERFRALLDQTHDLIFVVSIPQCRIIDVNGSACRDLGCERDALLGQEMGSLLPADGALPVSAFLCEGSSAGMTTLISSLRHADGRDIPMEITLSRVVFQGEMYGVVVCRDVAERQKAEEAARREEVLARLNRELEGRVRERTLELARANELLRSAGMHGEKAAYHSRLLAERYREHQMHLRKVLALSRALLSEESLEGALQHMVDTAREVLCVRYAVAGHGFMEDTFHVDATSRHEEAAPCPPGRRFAVEKGGVYLELLRRVSPLRLTDRQFREHPEYRGLPEGHAPLRGLLGAPLTGKTGKACGFIMLSDKIDGSDFSEEDEMLLLQITAVASLGIRYLECVRGVELRVGSCIAGGRPSATPPEPP